MTAAARVVAPRYLRLPTAGLCALFPSRETVSVQTGRERRYPGLIADASDNRGIYAGLEHFCPHVSSVVDIGCGSGLGTSELAARFERVSAVDSDEGAVQFARHYLPDVRVFGTQEAPTGDDLRNDLACVVDVLGQAAEPVEVLRRARRSIAADGRVFVAEVRAYPSQMLVPPVRRAYSRSGLAELLVRSGLEPETWIDDIGHFVACLARPAEGDVWRSLERGDAERRARRFREADQAYGEVAETATGSLRHEGLLASAVARAEGGDFDGACAQLLAAAQASPMDARALTGLSEFSLWTGDALQALTLAVRALEDDACNAGAVQALAHAARGLQQNDAYASFRLASALAPADARAATELARLAAERGDFDYAIWVMERLRQFDPAQGTDFHLTLGWLCVNAGREGDARVEADIARAQAPDSPEVRELCTSLDQVLASR